MIKPVVTQIPLPANVYGLLDGVLVDDIYKNMYKPII